MIKIIALSGSLRKKSFNTGLLKAAESLASDKVELTVATLHGVPLYDGDLEERDGIPTSVNKLREQIADAHGLLISTPEYNNAVPGVLKNGIDWLSRRPDEKPHVFMNLPVAVIGASPGGFGTTLAQTAMLPILRTLTTQTWFGGRLMVSKAGSLFNDEGELTDDTMRSRLADFVENFAKFAAERS
ncbi:MAG: NAD(P)H-dependent oxidoreductase [Woeseia sp.]|nr:NAD(P)H-dependent oxidoreductase [Woeseia sp.]